MIIIQKIDIHDPLTPADLRSEGFDIDPGYVTTIRITPKQLIMKDEGENFKAISNQDLKLEK